MQQAKISHQGELIALCIPSAFGSLPSQQVAYSSIAISAIMAVAILIRSVAQLVEVCKAK